jgi:hypothetical protein
MNDDMLSPPSLSVKPPRSDWQAAISQSVKGRPIVLVLGMHRSGTSLCSHVLSALGVDMADKIAGPGNPAPTPDNPRGHWERWEIVEFHDRILGLFKRDYWGRFHDFPLPVAWWADPRVAQIRREVVAFLEARMSNGYFGFKDPRTARLMPVWHQIFHELKLAPKIVLCLRNPAQVARSLHARDGLDPAIGEYRWLVYLVDFFRYSIPYDFCSVEYEAWFDNPSANLAKICKFLDLRWQQSEPDRALVLSGIVDPALRHDAEQREANQPLVRSLYKLARRADQDGAARDQIAYMVSQFVGFQQLHRPFQQAFEEVAKVAAKFPELEQEAASLRAAVAEREAALRRAEQEHAAATLTLGAELEVLREGVAQAERESATLRATVAEREAAFQHAEQEARDRTAATEAMHGEITALWDILVQTAREAEQREGAATAMQGEIATLRDTLAQAEREARQRRAAAEASEAELRRLRERLTQAEGEATERRAAVAALEVQVATLQETLTAAREVGKAAVAAFRLDIAAPARLHRPRGWRRGIMRLFGAQPSL